MTPEQVLSMPRSDEKVQAALLLHPDELTNLVKSHIEINPLSKSSLVNFYTSPRCYIEYIYGDKEDKEAWLLGRAVECLLLECQYNPETKIWTKDVFDKKYVIAEKPDCRNKDNKAMWEGLLNDAKKNKQTLIPQSMYNKAAFMAEIALANPNCRFWIDRKQNIQKQLRWVDKRTGLPVIGYIDFEVDLAGHITIIDVKSSKADCPEEFSKDAYKLGYNFQVGSYLHGYHKMKYQFPEFKFMVISNMFPYDSFMVHVPSDLANDAKEEFDNILTAFRYCIDNNKFHMGADFWLFDTKEYHSLEKPRYIRSKFINYDKETN